jgi:hypothetical protein
LCDLGRFGPTAAFTQPSPDSARLPALHAACPGTLDASSTDNTAATVCADTADAARCTVPCQDGFLSTLYTANQRLPDVTAVCSGDYWNFLDDCSKGDGVPRCKPIHTGLGSETLVLSHQALMLPTTLLLSFAACSMH